MGHLSSFWAGAQDHGRTVDLTDLAERAGGWEVLERRADHWLMAGGVAPPKVEAWLRTPPRQTSGAALTLADDGYPERLRRIPRPPPVVCVEGDPGCLARPAVAVVGTRRCTSYGSSIARRLGASLAAAGVTVVSGLAWGIDAHAHKAALAHGLTAAVLGHGLGSTSPRSNRHLRETIVARGGAIVSVWPDEFQANPGTFPVRNQWISGLSDLVVIVEAPVRSGAMHTARAALEQGRDVFAVPGPVGAENSRGCLELIAQGAGVIVDPDSFVSQLTSVAPPPQDIWVQHLFLGATVEEVSKRFGTPVSELLAALSIMEVRGEVVRLPGQRYAPGGSPR